MPTAKRPGFVGRYVELPDDLDERFRTFCEARGARLADQIRLALERHLAYPPPVADLPALPDATPVGQPRGRRRRKA